MSRTSTPRLLNWQQVCKLLGCKKTHFYYLVNSGMLRAVRIGQPGSMRGVRVDEAEVARFLRERKDAVNTK